VASLSKGLALFDMSLRQAQSWDSNTCALFCPNDSSDGRMQAQVLTSVRSWKYRKSGISPYTCYHDKISHSRINERNWECIVLNNTAHLVTVHSASLSSGERVLSLGIYVVGVGWYRSSMIIH